MVQAQTKRQKSIKSKLMAAVAMLLVSSIMMVSSTYAWFTLSTAPEVTGISTAVGANGNLEMALLSSGVDFTAPDFGITSAVGDSTASGKAVTEANKTWGNLVELGNNNYGLEKITLYPAALSAGANATRIDTSASSAILDTPEYGADGRVSQLRSNAFARVYNNGAFSGAGYGVRAVGTSSGMSPLELAYNGAISAASKAATNAESAAQNSMSANGTPLAAIAVDHAMGDNIYNDTDVATLKNVVSSMQVAVDYLWEAVKQYVLADTLADTTVVNETNYNDYVTAMNGADKDDLTVGGDGKITINTTYKFNVNTNAQAAITRLLAVQANLDGATSDLNSLSGDAITWAQILIPMQKLANPSAMMLSDGNDEKGVSEINPTTDFNFVYSATTLTMKSGSGVYADVADFVGNYSKDIVIKVTLEQISSTPIDKPVTMTAATTRGTTYLADCKSGVGTVAKGDGTSSALSDFYGYIIDLGFRTNAADSYLQLQADAVDRIYSDGSNAATMGHGSYMEFTSNDQNYSADQLKQLLANLKIIFFDTDSGNIYSTASLDLTNADVTGVNTSAVSYTLVGTDATYEEGTTYYTLKSAATTQYELITTEAAFNAASTVYTHDDTNGYVIVANKGTWAADTYYVAVQKAATYEEWAPNTAAGADPVATQFANAKSGLYTKAGGTTEGSGYAKVKAKMVLADNATYITELEQNKAKAVSVLVYLDGTNVTNADVAVSGDITGTMNLQFSSSAALDPMDYSGLKSGTTTGGDNQNPESYTMFTNVSVSGADGVTAVGGVKDGNGYIALTGDAANGATVAITVDGTSVTATAGEYNGVGGYGFTMPENATAASAVVVTVTPASSGN